jgi:hypothetical protein
VKCEDLPRLGLYTELRERLREVRREDAPLTPREGWGRKSRRPPPERSEAKK